MSNKNEKVTDYFSPKDMKELNEILERAIRNAQTISAIKQRAIIVSEDLDYNKKRIKHDIEVDNKLVNELKKKAIERKRRERNLKMRAAQIDKNTLRSLKQEFQTQ